MKKLFGGINLTWTKVIIFAIFIAIYTALINQVPILFDTSFRDIAISFEWWILFAIIIIMNSKSNLDAALKTFVFFLISQPLIYLIEVPFLGWQIMGYYKFWVVWTILTFPMAYIGYYMKNDKWYGLLILSSMLVFLGYHASGFLSDAIFSFPHHLLSFIFCIVTMFLYVLCIFSNKKIRIAGIIINIIILIVVIVSIILNPPVYEASFKCSGDDLVYDDSYKVYLKDSEYGNISIEKIDSIDDYCIVAKFKKAGKTEFTLESPFGYKKVFDIIIKKNTYDIEEHKN